MKMSEVDPSTLFPEYPSDCTGAGWAGAAVDIGISITALEEEIERLKLCKTEAIRRAMDAGIKDYEGYKFIARYKEGEKFIVDAGMLNIAYPAIHQELMARAIRDIKLKPTKKEVLAELVQLIGDEDAARSAIETCGFHVKTETQYVITKGAAE